MNGFNPSSTFAVWQENLKAQRPTLPWRVEDAEGRPDEVCITAWFRRTKDNVEPMFRDSVPDGGSLSIAFHFFADKHDGSDIEEHYEALVIAMMQQEGFYPEVFDLKFLPSIEQVI